MPESWREAGSAARRVALTYEVCAAERDEARQQLANLRAELRRIHGDWLKGAYKAWQMEGELARLLADPACGGPVHGDET